MPGRVRFSSVQTHTGGISFSDLSVKESTRIIAQKTCRDSSGYTFHEPLEIIHFEATGGIINGDSFGNLFQNYPCDGLNVNYQDTVYDPFAPPEAYLYTKLLSSANPSKADISLPNVIWELKDLPGLIKAAGDSIISSALYAKHAARLRNSHPRMIANKYLEYKFGLAPLISDALTLVRQSETIQKRFNRLKNLREGGRETVKRTLAKTHANLPSLGFVQSQGGTFLSSAMETHSHHYSGYVTWVLNNPNILPSSDDQLRTKAMLMAYKRTLDFEVVWDMIPWSWLIDYFTNVGDICSLTNNRLDVSPTNVRLMRHSKVTKTFSKATSGNAECSPLVLNWEVKSRWIPAGVITPTFWVGALTSSQLGILAALITSRSR